MQSTESMDTVLIVDDNPNNLEVLSETLIDAGLDVAVATSGEGMLRQMEHRLPSLILLDVMMPGMSGFEACQQLKANPATWDIPVLFMTALADTADKVKGFSLGAVDYITKPFQKEEVVARVRTHLKLRSLAKNLEEKVEERTAALSRSLQELQRTQLQLVQSEKMSTLGQLVAGVAHEINNPVGFLAGNLNPAREYVTDLFRLIALYQQKYPNPDPAIKTEIEAMDLDYIRDDLPQLLNSMEIGIERVRGISTSLRTFSRSDKDYKVAFDLHEGIDSTLLILKHRLKANERRPEIQVVKTYGDLPQVTCFPGQLNQVFMNILANAIDALEESNQTRSFQAIEAAPNRITIATTVAADGAAVLVQIADNGVGMAETVQQHIFDYSFTTKAVGQGTGLGLAIAHQIVTEKHGGTLSVTSTPGQGTEFVIRLPLLAPEPTGTMPKTESPTVAPRRASCGDALR